MNRPETARDNNRRAGVLMLATAVLYSVVIPAALYLQAPTLGAFAFVSGLRLGGAISLTLFCLLRWKRVTTHPQVRSEIYRQVMRPGNLVLLTLAFMGNTAIILAFRYIDPEVGYITSELWPILMLLGTGFIMQGTHRFQNPGLWKWAMVVTSFAGVAAVVISQSPDRSITGVFTTNTLIGVALALLAASCGLYQPFIFLWSHRISQRLRSTPEAGTPREIEDVCALMICAAGIAWSCITNGAISAITGELATAQGWSILAAATVVGLTVEAGGQVCELLGMLRARDLSPVALIYLNAPLALLLMALLNLTEIINPLVFGGGAAAVIAANIALTMSDTRRTQQPEASRSR